MVSLVIRTRDPQSIQGERMNTLRLGYGGALVPDDGMRYVAVLGN